MADATEDIAALVYTLRAVADEVRAASRHLEGVAQRMETTFAAGIEDMQGQAKPQGWKPETLLFIGVIAGFVIMAGVFLWP